MPPLSVGEAGEQQPEPGSPIREAGAKRLRGSPARRQQRGPHCPGQQRILFVHTNNLFSQKNKTRTEPVAQAPCGFFFSCASRSRTYDGGVKVPCLTAWRWRTGKNQYSRISFICQAKAFCRVCAKCFATLLPCLYSVLVIMRTACPFSALFSQKVLTPPS